mgnify:FL=1
MKIKKLKKLVLTATVLFGIQSGALAAPMTFEGAVADYKAGKYQSALSMFKTINASRPNNAYVRYYMGLCQHRLGHIDQAKQEYQAVISIGDTKLRPLAQQALSQLSGAHSSSGGYSSPAGSASTPSQTTSSRKVKKVIEFYADW